MKEVLDALAPVAIRFLNPDKKIIEEDISAFIKTGRLPTPTYPSLTSEEISKLKSTLLDFKRSKPILPPREDELLNEIVQFKEQEIDFLETALMHNKGASSGSNFVEKSQQLYGKIDADLFASLVCKERERLQALKPTTSEAAFIHEELLALWPLVEGNKYTGNDTESLRVLSDIVRNKFTAILSTVNKDAYSTEEVLDVFNRILKTEGYSQLGWKAVIKPDAHNLSVSIQNKELIISPYTKGDKLTIQQKALHEIGVHIQRASHAEKQDHLLLMIGLKNYIEGEEGLGIAVEVLWAGTEDTQSTERAIQRYLLEGLALGIDGRARTFKEIYEIAWRRDYLHYYEKLTEEPPIDEIKTTACRAAFRLFRGTNLKEAGVVFTRDHVYLDGYLKTIELFLANPNKEFLETMLAGRFNQCDPEQLKYVLSLD